MGRGTGLGSRAWACSMPGSVGHYKDMGALPLEDKGTGCNGPAWWTREPTESDGSVLNPGGGKEKADPRPPSCPGPFCKCGHGGKWNSGVYRVFPGPGPQTDSGVLTFGQTWPWVRRDFLLWIKIIFIFSQSCYCSRTADPILLGGKTFLFQCCLPALMAVFSKQRQIQTAHSG